MNYTERRINLKRSHKSRGFTIVELMVVIIIIGLLAVFVVPRTFKGLGAAKSRVARSKMAILESGIEQFFVDCGRYPSTLDELIEQPEDTQEKWNGRYCKPSDLEDPWGNPYIYEEEGIVNIGSYDLISYGADGEEGGEGDDSDIVNE